MMDEMTAFEQHVAAELDQMAGPGRRLDGMAMVRSVSAAAEASSSRSASMVNATTFVIAGVILALFAAVLLVGSLSQPNDERGPSIGASASVMPTAAVQLDEVRPGIERIVRDGSSQVLDDVKHVAVASDGSVWLATDTTVFALGDADAAQPLGVASAIEELTVLPDGTPLVHDGERLATWDGESWSSRTVTGDDQPAGLVSITQAEDGALWVVTAASSAHDVVLARLGRDAETLYSLEDLGLGSSGAVALTSLSRTPDGSLWAGVSSYGFGTPNVGLLRHEGSTWRPADPFGDDSRFATEYLTTGPDGILHAAFETDKSSLPMVGSWDSVGWTIAEDPATADGLEARDRPTVPWRIGLEGAEPTRFGDDRVEVDGNGRRWSRAGGLGSLEGDAFIDYWFPGPFAAAQIGDVAVADDGAVWVVLEAGDPTTEPEGPRPGLYRVDPALAAASTPDVTTVGREGLVPIVHPRFATRGVADDQGPEGEWATRQGTDVVAYVVGVGDRWYARLDSVGPAGDRWVRQHLLGAGDDPIGAIESALEQEPEIDFAREAAAGAVLEWPSDAGSP